MLFKGIISTAVIIFLGCCPGDTFLGEVDLIPSSKNFNPYYGVEALIFQNSEKDTLIFRKSEFLHSYNSSSIERPCSKSPIVQTNIYYTTEFIRIYFSRKVDENFSLITFSLRVQNLEKFLNGRFTPADMVHASASLAGESLGNISLVANSRGSDLDSLLLAKHPLYTSTLSIGKIVLNSTHFEEVFTNEHYTGSQIYYTKKHGIIGFHTKAVEVYNLAGLTKFVSEIE